MAKVLIGIGSNIEPDTHIRQAVQALLSEFQHLRLSSVYESKPIGFNGANFLNLVAYLETEMQVNELQSRLKQIEVKHGRDLNAAKFTSRTIDLDILLYDDLVQQADAAQHQPQLPREEITYNAFVLQPLTELVANWQHPILKQTYAALWQELAANTQAQTLWPVSFDWSER